MKQLLIISLFLVSQTLFSQSDTLFFRNKEKIAVKVYEISDHELKYKRTDIDDSPLYITSVEDLLKIKYKNGTTQVFIPDELSISYDTKEILKQREAFKFHVFDLPTGKISFGYERVIRAGINADFKVGVFNSNLYSAFNTKYEGSMFNPYGAGFAGGTFVRGGIKFLLPSNYQLKGMKYSHLLNGAYVRFDTYISYIQYEGIKYSVPGPNYVPANYNNYPYTPSSGIIEKTTSAANYNYGFMICFGKQNVVANLLTIDYYAGLGFNGSTYSFSENDFGVNGPNTVTTSGYSYRSGYYRPESSNVLAAQRFTSFLCGSVGFNIGFVYKQKAAKK